MLDARPRNGAPSRPSPPWACGAPGWVTSGEAFFTALPAHGRAPAAPQAAQAPGSPGERASGGSLHRPGLAPRSGFTGVFVLGAPGTLPHSSSCTWRARPPNLPLFSGWPPPETLGPPMALWGKGPFKRAHRV